VLAGRMLHRCCKCASLLIYVFRISDASLVGAGHCRLVICAANFCNFNTVDIVPCHVIHFSATWLAGGEHRGAGGHVGAGRGAAGDGGADAGETDVCVCCLLTSAHIVNVAARDRHLLAGRPLCIPSVT
jgi:hypothetical protein